MKGWFLALLAACGMTACSTASKYDMMATVGSWSLPENELTLEQRTTYFNDRDETDILKDAEVIETGFNGIKIVEMHGTPYEMGFQNGRLNKVDIQDNIYHVVGLVKQYASLYDVDVSAMDEVYDQMEPFIPLEDKLEMRGLAHGAEIPLRLVHWYHAIPELSEYGGKKQFIRGKRYNEHDPGFIDDPELETCSGVITYGNATEDDKIIHMRVLDWIRELGAQRYPTIHVYNPDEGQSYASFSYAGFTGCFTGMNENIAMGEMGYGNRNFETLEGIPFVFLYKKIGREAETIEDATEIVEDAIRTCSYVYQFSGKSEDKEHPAIMMVSDKYRFETLYDNQPFTDEGDEVTYEGIDDVIFAGHDTDILRDYLADNHGKMDIDKMIDLGKIAAMDGNVQVVIMTDEGKAYVANAANNDSDDKTGRASEQEYFPFDMTRYTGD